MNSERAARLHEKGRCTKARRGFSCHGEGRYPHEECGPLPGPTLADAFRQFVYEIREDRAYARDARRKIKSQTSTNDRRQTLGERWRAFVALRNWHLS